MITEHAVRSPRHTSFFLASGPREGTPVIFLHGWPELSLSWRGQLPVFGALGFRAVAPDMRGYGRSTVHEGHAAYAVEEAVADMIELIDSLGADRAVWVGHDWGAPVVWALAQQHPERVHGLAALCVPYFPEGLSPEAARPFVDRALYPEATHPWGQWDYILFHWENFDACRRAFEADPAATVRALFRAGSAESMARRARTSEVRANGGWFPGGRAPDLPRDERVISAADEAAYAAALTRTGFSGPDGWYMNADANRAYAQRARDRWRLEMPVLFLHAAHDQVCNTVGTGLAEPMREWCADLAEVTVPSGHWMAQERPQEVNAALARWLGARFPELWLGA